MKKIIFFSSIGILPLLLIFLIIIMIPAVIANSVIASTSTATKISTSQMIEVTTGTKEQNEFINKIGNATLSDDSSVLHSITIAQAIIESNWGQSTLASQYNNLFGIKGKYNGNCAMMPTLEFFNGAWTQICAAFRVYDNYEESIKDHSDFLVNNSRYKMNGLFDTQDYKGQAEALQRAGYATAPNYSESLITIIETYNLAIFDNYISESCSNSNYITNVDNNSTKYPPMSNDDFDKLMNEALKYRYYRYTFGGIAPHSFDCSELTRWCYGFIGVNFGRTAQMQYDQTEHISIDEAQPGDLIFWTKTYMCSDYISHVEILINDTTTYGAGSPIDYHYLDKNNSKLVCAGRIKK